MIRKKLHRVYIPGSRVENIESLDTRQLFFSLLKYRVENIESLNTQQFYF